MGTHADTAARVVARPVAQPAPRVVRGDALKAAPWKNGGGVTREIAAYPVGASLDTFVWRVSVADVERSGPFSQFPGIDRKLVLLAGSGMHLAQARGATHALMEPLAVAAFDGEAAFDAQLVDGATRDFNLMVRRDRADATLEIWPGAHARRCTLAADAALVFCAGGGIDVHLDGVAPGCGPALSSQVALGAMDTLLLESPSGLACEVTGDGTAIVIQLRYV
jgi:environmental stress-induced protein Ves